MEIKKTIKNRTLTIALNGRLDSNTSPDLEASLKSDINKIDNVILDLEKCEYISSAGLRVILAVRKHLNTQGELIVRNVCSSVMEVFELTGFSSILTFEE